MNSTKWKRNGSQVWGDGNGGKGPGDGESGRRGKENIQRGSGGGFPYMTIDEKGWKDEGFAGEEIEFRLQSGSENRANTTPFE
ncbi:unnamed protein product, partial [Linum tenue]